MSRIQYQVVIPFTARAAAEKCVRDSDYCTYIDMVCLEEKVVETSRERVDYD